MECIFYEQQYLDMKYSTTTLKTSLIGWKYKLPNDNSKLVMLSDLLPNPSFYITSWKELSECISTEDIVEVLVFSSDYSNDNIINCAKNHILVLLEKYADKYDERTQKVLTSLKGNFENDNELDLNDKIIFNLEMNQTKNVERLRIIQPENKNSYFQEFFFQCFSTFFLLFLHWAL